MAIETRLAPLAAFTLRTHQVGDIGWIVHRHGVLYARECGWGTPFEALIADLGAKFLRNFDAGRERCWIAEKDGSRVGSVLLMKVSEETAQLRLLLVEPEARGLGIAKRLVDECIAFARASGYRKLMLVTHASLDAAQHIYVKAGFHAMDTPPPAHFGEPEPRRAWELSL
jgi:GNAT superfamily N-acetyltransferase